MSLSYQCLSSTRLSPLQWQAVWGGLFTDLFTFELSSSIVTTASMWSSKLDSRIATCDKSLSFTEPYLFCSNHLFSIWQKITRNPPYLPPDHMMLITWSSISKLSNDRRNLQNWRSLIASCIIKVLVIVHMQLNNVHWWLIKEAI